jgi:predicted metal-binding membrane protein
VSHQSSRAGFAIGAGLLFAASATATIAWGASMSAMGGMPMPGGWTMSMTWMRLPGQTGPGAAAAFLGMWTVMMVAMMLPALVPAVRRYREAVREVGVTRLGRLTTMVGAGYFSIWIALGLVVFPLGVAVATVEMEQPALARAVPIAVAVVVLMAGAAQFTGAKARHLASCRQIAGVAGLPPSDLGGAWRAGARHGLHCVRSCAGPTAILLALGVMDLGVMAVVTAAITLERLVPASVRAVGVASLAAGLLLIVRAAGLG